MEVYCSELPLRKKLTSYEAHSFLTASSYSAFRISLSVRKLRTVSPEAAPSKW